MTIKFKPVKKVKRKTEAQRLAEEAREKQRQREEQILAWMRQNERKINIKRLISMDQKISDQVRTQVLELFIKAHGTVDGLIKADETLRIALGLEEVRLDINYAQDLVNNVFRLQFAKLVVENSDLDSGTAQEILSRILIREMPTGDKSDDPVTSLLKEIVKTNKAPQGHIYEDVETQANSQSRRRNNRETRPNIFRAEGRKALKKR